MKISNKLPQFENEKALIIVTSKHEGKLYEAHAGEIVEIDSFKISTPEYSDKEGFYAGNGHSQAYGGNVIRENNKGKMITDLQNEIQALVTKPETDHIDTIYLFTPQHLINIVENAIPIKLRKKIIFSFGKDYSKEHPFQILEKIREAVDSAETAPANSDTMNLLSNTFKAQNGLHHRTY